MTRKGNYKLRAFWEKHVALWKQSDLTQAEYCRQHNLQEKTFSKWKHKFMSQSKSIELVPVALPLSVRAKCENSSGFHFAIGRYRLEIENDFDPVVFKHILNSLEAI